MAVVASVAGATVILAPSVHATPRPTTTSAPRAGVRPATTSTPATTTTPIPARAPNTAGAPSADIGPTSTILVGPTVPPERPAPAYVANPVGDRQRAAAYAFIWADGTNPAYALYSGGVPTVPSDNLSARGRAIDSVTKVELDCTSFMSQALHVGGFAYTPQWRYDPVKHSATVAWVRASGPQGLSALFLRLGRFRLVDPRGTTRGQPPPPGVQIGDVVVWDLNSSPKQLHIDHQLMVTEVTGDGSSWGDIRVSYHTYDHRNRAMDEYQDFVAPDAPRARLYVFHVNYAS